MEVDKDRAATGETRCPHVREQAVLAHDTWCGWIEELAVALLRTFGTELRRVQHTFPGLTLLRRQEPVFPASVGRVRNPLEHQHALVVHDALNLPVGRGCNRSIGLRQGSRSHQQSSRCTSNRGATPAHPPSCGIHVDAPVSLVGLGNTGPIPSQWGYASVRVCVQAVRTRVRDARPGGSHPRVPLVSRHRSRTASVGLLGTHGNCYRFRFPRGRCLRHLRRPPRTGSVLH